MVVCKGKRKQKKLMKLKQIKKKEKKKLARDVENKPADRHMKTIHVRRDASHQPRAAVLVPTLRRALGRFTARVKTRARAGRSWERAAANCALA